MSKPTIIAILLLLLVVVACLMCMTHGFTIEKIWEDKYKILAFNNSPKTHYDARENLFYVVTDYHLVAFNGTSGTVRREFKIPNKICNTQSVTFPATTKGSMWYSHTYNILPNFVLHHMDLETGVVSDYTIPEFTSQGYLTHSISMDNNNGLVLMAVVSTPEDPAHRNTVAAFKIDESSSPNRLEVRLKWKYTFVYANLNALVFDDQDMWVWVFASNRIAKINVKTGNFKFTNDALPEEYLIMSSKGFLSPDKSHIYLAGMNLLSSYYGVGIIVVDASNGKFVKWYSISGSTTGDNTRSIQMKQSIDENHLYLTSEKGASMFCIKERKMVWYRQYTEPSYYSISAIGSMNTPIIAYASQKNHETIFAQAEQKGQLMGTFDQYLGDALIGNITSRGKEFFTCVNDPQYESRVQCSRRRIIT